MANRYYDPTTATFLTPDPLTQGSDSPQLTTGIGYEDGQTTVANPFHYVGNDPVNFVDPLGLCRAHDGAFLLGFEIYGETAPACLGHNDMSCRGESGDTHSTDDETAVIIGELGGCYVEWWEEVCERVQFFCDHGDTLIDAIDLTAGFLPGFDCMSAVTWDRSWARAGWCGADLIPWSGFARLGEAASTAARACSFSGDTEVVMADGRMKPIAEVDVGDEVLATDPVTGETAAREVTAAFAHEDTVIDLVVEGGKVTTTSDHPFWNETEDQWEKAEDLDVGDRLRTADGDTITVEGLEEATEREAVAYNLTVDQTHTYYVAVGDDEALVHNSCPVGGGRLAPDFEAMGPHSTFRRNPSTGRVTHHATWQPQTNARNPAPWELVQRVDVVGKAHYNKVTGQYVPTPHTQGPAITGGVRRAFPWEVPHG